MEQVSQWQLFNTSWTLHRLSPLHHGKDFETLLDNPAALQTYATRLRDQLTGDILAGLHASATIAEDDALSKTGALKQCLWQSISTGGQARRAGPSFPGILVTLEYENITYKAALLAEAGLENQREGSTFLPLLLTKFPNALRQTFISFLSANFDTYCSNLRLPSAFICKGLEKFVNELRNSRGPSGRSAANETIEEGIKELQLTLAFSPSIAPALRTLNISISRASLIEFLRDEAPQSKRTLKQELRSPLVGNLAAYLETHLAMQLDLDGSSPKQASRKHVRLSKIACAAFVLGGEGRMKLVVAVPAADDQPDDARGQNSPALHASEMLLEMVVRRAIIGNETTT
ncbi:uncharacterized protein N7477_000353 [Penicillium maclennaniae]|uniref:uncharacterized protein n=1 Tax=Penicillium maclennaniae TaxID=1343394 RepID=UPI0025424861|nr:uncharacterized protein N7477_000353 [Penicillium maclennaniae]KAJ5684008.1 hypothetical protein N7477_000353 [Penicillium maclennaniae]